LIFFLASEINYGQRGKRLLLVNTKDSATCDNSTFNVVETIEMIVPVILCGGSGTRLWVRMILLGSRTFMGAEFVLEDFLPSVVILW
jgi:hypothetical protein